MATPAEVEAQTLARINQTSTLTGEIIENTQEFMQALLSSATGIEIPYINWTPTIFTPAPIQINAEPPESGTNGVVENTVAPNNFSQETETPSDFSQETAALDDFRQVATAPDTFVPDVIDVNIDNVPDEFIATAPDTFVPDVITVNIENVPDFGAAEPQVNLPTPPDTGLPNMPSEPVVITVSVPEKPAYDLPTAPTISDFAIPDPPAVVIPQFGGTVPTNSLVAPSGNLEWSEAEYTTLLLTAVKTKLLNDVQNGVTGFGTDVLDDLWALQAERDEITFDDGIDKIVDEWAERGFPLPDGVVSAEVDEAAVNFANRRTDRGREINIKEADLIQKNNHFAMAAAMQTEGMLIQHADNVAQRALRAAIATIEMGIAIFDAQVRNYNSQLETYRVQAMVYEQLIRAELAKVEVYRAQIEGTKLRVEVQKQYVEIYRAQIEAVNTIIRAYKTEMEAANIQANVERSKIEVFRAQVAGYGAQVGAKTAEYGMYKAQIEGEMSKVAIYETQVKAYAVEVQALRARQDGQIAQAGAEIDIEKMKLGVYDADITKYRTEKGVEVDIYKTKQAGQIAQAGAEIDIEKMKLGVYDVDINKYKVEMGAEVDVYEAEISKYRTEVGAEISAYTATISRYRAELDSEIRAYQSNILKFRADVDQKIEKVRALEAMYGHDISKYNIQVGKGEAEARIQAVQQEIVLKNIDSNVRMAMEAAKSNITAFVNVAGIKVGAQKGGADAYSAMASSAMQAIAVLLQLSSEGLTTTTGT